MLSVSRNTIAFEIIYGCVGAAVTLWALLSMSASWYLAAGLLSLAAAVMSPFSIRMRDPVRLPGAMPLEVAVMLIAPPQVSIVVAAANNLASSLWYKRPPVRTLFNVANLAVPNALGTVVLALSIHNWPQPLTSPWYLLAAGGAVVVRMMGNMAGQAGLRGAAGRRNPWPVFKDSVTEEWRTGGFGIRLMPVMMALAFPTIGWWTLVPGMLLQISIGLSLRRYQDRIDRQTLTDGLTNVGNRKAWEMYRNSDSSHTRHLIAIVDIDGLKHTNDQSGHEAGDTLLVDIAHRLRGAVPEGEVYRLGGDEFLVTLPGAFDALRGRRAVEDALLDFGHHWQAAGHAVSASVGFAVYPDEAPDMRAAMSLADKRMYEMKQLNRRLVAGN